LILSLPDAAFLLTGREMRARTLAPWIWLAPAGALLIPFFLLPITILVRNSVYQDGPAGFVVPDFTWKNYATVLSDPYYLQVFGNTLISAVGIVLLALLISYPFAWLLSQTGGRSRVYLVWAVYLPIYASVIMRVFGWMVIIADSGMINQALLKIGLIETPIRMINEAEGMTIGLLHRYLPLMIIPLATALAKVDSSLLRASANLGAGWWFTWRRVILPISIPGAVAGTQLVFAAVLSDYVIPAMMGTTRFQMLAPAIFYEATTNARWALSGAIGSLVLVSVILFLVIMNLIVRRFAPWAGL
jgi:ABC-type spermidine/putrescine transport system permease subunit I